MIGFWSIAFVYAWVGAHHIIHGPCRSGCRPPPLFFRSGFLSRYGRWCQSYLKRCAHIGKYHQSAAHPFFERGVIFYLDLHPRAADGAA